MPVIARLPVVVETILSPEPPSYSVLWVLSEEPGELEAAMTDLVEALGPLICRATYCGRTRAKQPRQLGPLDGCEVVEDAEVRIGDEGSICEVVEVDVLAASEFWRLFEVGSRMGRIVGGLFRAEISRSDRWAISAIHVAMGRAMPMARVRSSYEVRYRLLDAFMAETVLDGGVAFMGVGPEFLWTGIGLVGASTVIDEYEAALAHLPRADEVDVRHSVEIEGTLPW